MQSENLRPGSHIDTHFLNRLSNQANRGAIQVAGQCISAQDTPGGMVVAMQPDAEYMENCVRMAYLGTGGLTLPPYTIVHFVTGEGSTTPGINYWPLPSCDITDQTGRVRIGILQEGASPGGCPMVQYQGISFCYWDATTVPWALSGSDATNPEGHRLGSLQGSPFPIWDDNGPLMILSDSITSDNSAMFTGLPGGHSHMASVKITGERNADAIFCLMSGAISAPYSCIIASSAYTLRESDGDVYLVGP